jgi:tetratricopeptide (TPR) repeat protein
MHETASMPKPNRYSTQCWKHGAVCWARENPDTLLSMNNLAGLYRREGKGMQAEPLFVNAMEIQSRVLGPNHPLTLASMNNLAGLYQAEGKYGQAGQLFEKVLASRRRAPGPEHSDTLLTLRNLVRLNIDRGDYARAEPQARELLSILENKALPDGSAAIRRACLAKAWPAG